MRQLFLIPLGLCLATASCHAALKQPTKVLLAQAPTDKIAQVKAGTLKTAKASWWGFDKQDATECLQNAINSRVPTLIVDNTGSDWLVNKTINLVSNQKIIFEDGVVVQAMKGEFKDKSESLVKGNDVHDVTLEGQGHAVLAMQKADYDNPKLYKKSEHRHGLSIRGSRNVTLRNFTVTKTGGDGLYLGNSKTGDNDSILLEKMNFDDNYRQGISVISAQNLTIRNCRLNNTSGTAPQSGIDFEPNSAREKLINCIVEDCVIYNNDGAGITINVAKFDADSEPVSITFKNCKIKGNPLGFKATITRSPDGQPRGKVLFENCSFDQQKIFLRNPLLEGIHFLFRDCTLDLRGDSGSWSDANAPIVLRADGNIHEPLIGGVKFDNTTVLADKFQVPVGFNVRKGGFGYHTWISSQIDGSLFVKVDGEKIPVNLPVFLASTRMQLQRANRTNTSDSKFSKVVSEDISKEWYFQPNAANGKSVTSPQFDDSSWKVIDGGHRQWWQKQGFSNYHGEAWYRKNVTVPQLSSNQKVTLYFNGIDGHAQIYVNGEKVGEHILGKDNSGWDKPFFFDVTKAMHSGNNLIAIAVTSKSKDGASGINESIHLVTGVPR